MYKKFVLLQQLCMISMQGNIRLSYHFLSHCHPRKNVMFAIHQINSRILFFQDASDIDSIHTFTFINTQVLYKCSFSIYPNTWKHTFIAKCLCLYVNSTGKNVMNSFNSILNKI